jgi:membrane associated rhomboid family serine protease
MCNYFHFSFFSYMLVHQDAEHLWPNLLIQLVLSGIATVRHPGFIGQLKIGLIYALSGYGGGVAYSMLDEKSSIALVGASAGVFGLCGLCIVDFTEDLWDFVCEGRAARDTAAIQRMTVVPTRTTRGLSERTELASRALQRAASVVEEATSAAALHNELNFSTRIPSASPADLTTINSEEENAFLIGDGVKSGPPLLLKSVSVDPTSVYFTANAKSFNRKCATVKMANNLPKSGRNKKRFVLLAGRAMLILWIVVSDLVAYADPNLESEESHVAHFAGLFVGLLVTAVLRIIGCVYASVTKTELNTNLYDVV